MSLALDRDQAFLEAVRRVGEEVAAPNAADVDRQARFPAESVAALREQRTLSCLLPGALGGADVSFRAVATGCFELGRHCGASAMVFAMHQIQVATLLRHLEGSDWFEDYLSSVADEQRLIASVTSEVGNGGDMGRSVAAAEPTEAGLRFEKQAPTVSFGEYADDLLTTLRRAPDAEPGDQVLVLTRSEQNTLQASGSWDPLGMRGTCSPGFVVSAEFPREQVLVTPFARVAAESMVPISHLLWSHLWLGIATDAFDRARAFARAAARRSPGRELPSSRRLSSLMSELSLMRAEVSRALDDFCEASQEPDRPWLSTVSAALRFNNLKISASEQAPRVCHGALEVCGIMGYRNDSPFSVGRHLRDALSASLMISNERIHQTNANLLLIAKDV